LKEHRGLEAYLDQIAELQWKERDLNRKILKAIVGYYVESGVLENALMELLEKIEPLAELRNKSIIAHEYQGLNREVLEERLSGSLEELMNLILMTARGHLRGEPDFLDRLSQVILREIQLKKEKLFGR